MTFKIPVSDSGTLTDQSDGGGHAENIKLSYSST